jgi:hypothetical protein
VGFFLGLGAGKNAHHGHGSAPAGRKMLDKQALHSEPGP